MISQRPRTSVLYFDIFFLIPQGSYGLVSSSITSAAVSPTSNPSAKMKANSTENIYFIMVILQYKHLINIRYCSIEHFCCKVTDFTFSSDGCRRNLLNSWSHCWVGGSLQCWSHLTLRPINSKLISQVFSNWLFSRFLPILGNGYESIIETLCSKTLSDTKFENNGSSTTLSQSACCDCNLFS